MQLYKNRGFNEFFQDTFSFLKESGGHYIKNFFVINGLPLIVLAVIAYYAMQYYTAFLLNNAFGGNGFYETYETPLDNFANANPDLFPLLVTIAILLAIVLAVMVYAYTPIYFKLYEDRGNNSFETSDIINSYKANKGILLKYTIFSLLLAIPFIIVFSLITYVLALTRVGLFSLPFFIAFLTGLYNMTLLEYLDNKKDYWTSFGYAWNLITSKFWPVIGAMGLFWVITYIVQLAVSILQSVYNATNVLTQMQPQAYGIEEQSLSTLIFTIFLFVLSFFVAMLMNVLNQTNQSVVYYGLKEKREKKNTTSEIDLIGSGE